MLRRFFLASALATLIFALPALAQTGAVEYGQPTELQGVKTVFVDTGTDMVSRDRIVKEIQKGAPGLSVVSRPEDADIHLRFYLDEDDYAVIAASRGGRVGVGSANRGSGTVVRVVDDKRVRVLWSYKDSQRTFLERRPSTNFGREFVKVYRRYN